MSGLTATPGATLTVQYVIDRAAAFSQLNPALMSNQVEMIARVRSAQRKLMTRVNVQSREYFVTVVPIVSSATSPRTLDLSQLNPPLERVLEVSIGGVDLNQVDVLDPDSELAPRYYAQGLSLVELNNEWSTLPGTAVATLTYGYGPTDLNPNGLTTQPLSVPDQWVDILVGELAAYCANKDYSRNASEAANATALRDSRIAELELYLDHTAGVRAMRSDVPHPTGQAK